MQAYLKEALGDNTSIYHPVTIIGLEWNDGWVYAIYLPSDHPQFVKGQYERDDFLDEWLFEAID